MVSCIGWLAQFTFGRDVIVCRKDGTLRMSEPRYDFTIAALYASPVIDVIL